MGAAVGACVDGEVIWASEGRSDATRSRGRGLPRRRHRRGARRRGRRDPLDLPAARGGRRRACVRRGSRGSTSTRTRSRRSARRRSPRCSRGSSTAASSAGRRPSPVRRSISRAPTPTRVAALFAGSPLATRDRLERIGGEDGVRRVVERARRRCFSRFATSRARTASRTSGGSPRRSSPRSFRARRQPPRRRAGAGSGEMEEIADTFAAAGQPEGFHRAAAEVYRA